MDQSPVQRQLEPRFGKLQAALAFYRGAALVLLVALLAETAFLIWQHCRTPFARAIRLDGQVVCFVRNEFAAQAVLRELLTQLRGSLTGPVELNQKWESLNWPLEKGAKVLSVPEAVRLLKPKVSIRVTVPAIQVDGKPVLYLASRDVAEMALAAAKAKFQEGPGKLVSTDFLQKNVQIVEAAALPAAVVSDAQVAADKLTSAPTGAGKYVVKRGDTWAGIAQRYGLRLSRLRELNPKARRMLHPGDVLVVALPTPPLTVVTVREESRDVEYTAKPERIPSETLPKGETRVVAQAEPGKKRETYRVTYHNGLRVSREKVAEEIIAPARPERIMVGKGVQQTASTP